MGVVAHRDMSMHLGRTARLACTAVMGSKVRRRYAIHALIGSILHRIGLELYNPFMTWPTDSEVQQVWATFKASSGRISERKYSLYQLAQSVQSVPGDTVECGAFHGGGSYLIMRGQEGGARKIHHIFDSFRGLSEPQPEDNPTGSLSPFWSPHDLAAAETVVHENLNGWGEFRTYSGWIPDEFHRVDGRSFSFVHLDVDLYQPTLDAISFFYGRTAPGGLIVCDDYGSQLCPGAKRAIDEFLNDKPERVIHLTTGQGVIVKSCDSGTPRD